jgi:FolB domain-containing protein
LRNWTTRAETAGAGAGYSRIVLDRIHIRDLLVNAIIGINPDERVNPQDILVNATLYVDTREAGVSDQMADSVNYSTVTKAMYVHIESARPGLVEKLVADLARVCFETDDRIEEVEITAEKPGAVTFTRSVGVTIHRTRDEVMEP